MGEERVLGWGDGVQGTRGGPLQQQSSFATSPVEGFQTSMQ